jgi:protein-S-isoprenylcysteine O-methyltransferase Ste14
MPASANLGKRAIRGLVQFQLAMALMLFVPAGSLRYWQAWIYWIVFSLAVTAITVHFMRADPALIERRLQAGPVAERNPRQKAIQTFAALFLCALLIGAGLDHRFAWSDIPVWLSLAADALVAAGLVVIFFVFRANSFASSIVEVTPGQRVISSGPYRFVRHPMYAGAAVTFIATPIALGSWWALVPAGLLCLAMATRAIDEERELQRDLAGYAEYCSRVRYRLAPGLW